MPEITPDFPLLDASRAEADGSYSRTIMDAFGFVDAHVPETDGYCSMPLRLVHDALGGWRVELGPYDLDAADLFALKQAITAFEQAIGVTLGSRRPA